MVVIRVNKPTSSTHYKSDVAIKANKPTRTTHSDSVVVIIANKPTRSTHSNSDVECRERPAQVQECTEIRQVRSM